MYQNQAPLARPYRSLKRFEQTYGLYVFEDRNGYLPAGHRKKKKAAAAVYTFNLLVEGYTFYGTDPQMGSLPQALLHPEREGPCEGETRQYCHGPVNKRAGAHL